MSLHRTEIHLDMQFNVSAPVRRSDRELGDLTRDRDGSGEPVECPDTHQMIRCSVGRPDRDENIPTSEFQELIFAMIHQGFWYERDLRCLTQALTATCSSQEHLKHFWTLIYSRL